MSDLFGGSRAGAMRVDRDELERWIDLIRAEGADRGLTAWESDYVDSVADQLGARGTLTDRQVEILEGIYEKRTRAAQRPRRGRP